MMSGPTEISPRLGNHWQTEMNSACQQAPTRAPALYLPCCVGFFCCFPCYHSCQHRLDILTDSDMVRRDTDIQRYVCCQGTICCAEQTRGCTDGCPMPCPVLEVCCCPGLSVFANHYAMQDRFILEDSECDQRIICCLNIALIVSCLCSVCSDGDSEEEQCFHTLVDCFYNAVVACYNAQHEVEIKHHRGLATAPAAGGSPYRPSYPRGLRRSNAEAAMPSTASLPKEAKVRRPRKTHLLDDEVGDVSLSREV
jgi:hypothetical protein